MRSTLFAFVIMLVILPACNLQQAPEATESIAPPVEESVLTPTVENAPQATGESPLLPTPLQQNTAEAPPLVITATLPPLNTLAPQGSTGDSSNSTALPPTLDPAQADNLHEIQARANTQIGLNYEATVEGGSVQLILQGPDGVIWEKTLTQTETDRIEFTTTQAGTYMVLVEINQLAGNYSISWD